MPVKIISDSTCDLSKELIEKYDIEITPLTVTLGEKSGKDGIDITPEDIYRYVEETGKLSKTGAVNSDEYEKVFRKWRDLGYDVVQFCIGSLFSSSYQSACIAAQEMDGVYVVDTANLSSGQGLTVVKAAEMAQQGASAKEIAAACEDMLDRVEASFVVNNIEYLHKGGRCSSLAALGSNIFHIKPCIEVIKGKMIAAKKFRGRIARVIKNYVEDRLHDRTDIEPDRIFITHTRIDSEIIETVKSLIRQFQPGIREILDTTAGATVTTHCGPDTLGVLFVRKK
jgi:DegV family protein with EDD domain